MPNGNDNWAEWSKHVILSIERLDEDIKLLNTKIGMVHDEVLQLRTRSSIAWSVLGAVGGAVITFCVFLAMELI